VARARAIDGLDADRPYSEAAAKVVAVRASELSEHSARVLDTSDIEGVHDMRVASRRLRAALEIFEPCFPPTDFRGVLKEVKAIADALGERRDRDVTIAALEDFSARVSAPDRQGIASLVRRLRAEQAAANEALAPFVASKRLEGLGERVENLVGAARE
jgi:CHAD domain-containing protein